MVGHGRYALSLFGVYLLFAEDIVLFSELTENLPTQIELLSSPRRGGLLTVFHTVRSRRRSYLLSR